MTMSLNGKQFKQLNDALRSAFSPDLLSLMIWYRLDINLHDISMAQNYEVVVFKLIQRAESEGWTKKLIVSAIESNPNNPKLLAFTQMLGMGPTFYNSQSGKSTDKVQFEKIINEEYPFIDFEPWYSDLGQLISSVCRIEFLNKPIGTGFLIGPSAIITNYHVVEKFISERPGYTPKKMEVRFDYRRKSDGLTTSPGYTYQLAEDWLLDYSPYSEADKTSETNILPEPDELDFAILRLEGSPGNNPIGIEIDPSSKVRGWIKLPQSQNIYKVKMPIFIVQHPKGEPIKIAFETQSMISTNANDTRIRYSTNTDSGSSGSPCFDINWKLIAIHQGGDPNVVNPTYNRGVPIEPIVALLQKRGTFDKLDN